MKAIVLAAGMGTRLRPVTLTMPKPIVPVANKPMVAYALDMIVAADITEIAIIVNSMESPLVSYFGDKYKTANMNYVVQTEQLGLAHAVKQAQDFIDGDDFCMFLGDNIFEDQMTDMLKGFSASDADAGIALRQVPDPQRFGIAVVEDGKIMRVVEKPADPPSDLAIVGVYMFRSSVFEIIDNLEPSGRGEYEITDAIQGLIDAGKNIAPTMIGGWYVDAGKPDPIILANQLLLESLPFQPAPEPGDTRIQGESDVTHGVYMGEGVQIIDSVVRGPVIIGANTVIRNSYVGPYTSIGEGSVIENTEIEASIIMNEVSISDVESRLEKCLIAHKAEVKGTKSTTQRLVISEYAKVWV